MPYDVGVFPLGGAPGAASVGGGTGWASSAQSKLQEEAWQFIAYIASKEAELDEVKIGQTTPSRISVATGPEYLARLRRTPAPLPTGRSSSCAIPSTAGGRTSIATSSANCWTPNCGPASAGAQVTKLIKEQGDPMLTS